MSRGALDSALTLPFCCCLAWTMPAHFARLTDDTPGPGVILLREATPISITIEELILIWNATDAEEWIDRLLRIPL